jgi:hypothetical protein
MFVREYSTEAVAAGTPVHGAPATLSLTPQQVAAIRDVMHIFVEDDLDRGVPLRASAYCPACDAPRPLAGFVRYDDVALCNACATDYEIARTRGLVADASEFIQSTPGAAVIDP